MATEVVLDPAGLNGFDWDSQGVGLYAAGSLLHVSGAAVRGGVIPATGSPLRYTLKAGMVGTLAAGTYVLPAPDPANGVYELHNPVPVDFTHPTSNVSQPRSDLIIAEVADVGTSSSFKKFRLLTGTAGVGAPDPTNPTSLGNGGWVALGRVNIPANASTLGSITDLRSFTAAAGGAVRVPDVASAAVLPEGTPFYAEDTDTLGWRTAAGTELVHRSSGGYFAATSNFAGDQNIPHGLGATPTKVSVSTGLTGDTATDNVALVKVTSVDAFSIGVRVFRMDTNIPLVSNLMGCWWTAEL